METTTDKSHVRNQIQACKGLPLGVRSVLAEVCAMCEHGGRGCFDANNRFLADKLGLSGPKVSAHLRTLERAGLLLIAGSGNGERRIVTPAETLRQAYRAREPETLTETIRDAYNHYRNDKGQTLTETITDPYRNDNPTLTETVTNPYRNGKHKRKEEELEEELKVLTSQRVAADAATAAAQKKIAELEERLAKATEIYLANQATLASKEKKISELQAKKTSAARFAPPVLDEVLTYMLGQRLNNPGPIALEAERYMGHYQSNGWKVGRNPMKDWRAACCNWLTKVPKDAPAGLSLATPPPANNGYGTAYGRPAQQSQVSIRTAAIAQADALVDAMAGGDYKPYTLSTS